MTRTVLSERHGRVGLITINRPEALNASMAELLTWYAEGRLTPHVSHEIPLERVEEAYDLLRGRKSTGKVVVTMR